MKEKKQDEKREKERKGKERKGKERKGKERKDHAFLSLPIFIYSRVKKASG